MNDYLTDNEAVVYIYALRYVNGLYCGEVFEVCDAITKNLPRFSDWQKRSIADEIITRKMTDYQAARDLLKKLL